LAPGPSIEYVNQRSLDDLFHVYPTIPEDIREVDAGNWRHVEAAIVACDNVALLKTLFAFDLFPIKDSNVAYLSAMDASSLAIWRRSRALPASSMKSALAKSMSVARSQRKSIRRLARSFAAGTDRERSVLRR
jgi:hypothetical protein